MYFLLLLNLLPLLVFGADVQERKQRGEIICSSYGYQVLEARFGHESYLLCLKMSKIGTSPLTSGRTSLLLDPDAGSDEIQAGRMHYLSNITMAYGFPVEDPNTGSAEGYIGEDHHFYGILHIGNRTLHADPYGRDDPKKLFGLLENDHVAAPKRPRRRQAQFGTGFDQLPYFPFRIEERQEKSGIAKARICDLLLLADKEFFQKDANSSLNHVVQRMMHAVAQADLIFRNADFNEDGIPDNIGFSVKYILVLTSHETNNRVFGDIVRDRTVDGRRYLMQFSRLRRLSEVCLGVAFSGHAFLNRTLGLSFTSLGGGMGGAAGGLCDRRAYGRSFNTLALAHATHELNERVPERVAALTLAHEMGHSFGAHHDDHFPNPDCRGYVMGAQSSPARSQHPSEFSICSKRLISATLSSMSYCLTEIDRPFCGNGIVEDGETCDCGLPSLCIQRDPCCTPRAGGALILEEGALHKEGCSVAPSVICHPAQGLCCTSECEYANLTASGIDCTMQEVECACLNLTSECRCGLGGRCLPDGSCHAAECAILGLRECPCPHSGPGGVIGKARMCGVCCKLKQAGDTERCLSAEFAARELMASFRLPADWPDEDYKGPNVTLKLCANDTCRIAQLRAWPPGDVCVSLNSVGICSPRGYCKSVLITPTSNVYPDIQAVKRTSRDSWSCSPISRGNLKSLLIINTILWSKMSFS
ncbi:disintegrin and metalloproteinase domain-containing protein 10-like [Maniola jurtina]|uniref:disintegrin and metalloproteinase domain-containing protein 10-like n=1 Tax=Maniola jurtina TaxID=191418 RepID=UPI001E689151|nr:disintegrin and metalloproteinase domain-containing protein 10-like [Maniola jurtina]